MNPRNRVLPLLAVTALLMLACGLSVSPQADQSSGNNAPGMSDEDRIATNVAATLNARDAAAGDSGDAASATDTPAADAPTNPPADAPTDTPIPPPTDTPLPTATPTEGDPTVTVSIDTNCRSGPGQAYDMIGALLVTEIGKIVGVPAVNTPYVIIKNPDGGADCWVWLEYATTNGNLDNLPKINVPPTPTPKVGGIKGMVWEDKCNPAAPGSPPPGCIDPPVPGPYIANGTFDGGESGIKGVVLDLGKGACFSTGFKTATTNNSGNYSFDNLQPGKYCVSITANLHGNDSDLIPGYWSFPYTLSITASYTITVDGGVIVTGINFGWDFD